MSVLRVSFYNKIHTTMFTTYIKKFLEVNKAEKGIRSALKFSSINLIAKAFGYGRSVVIAVLLGFSLQTDAFFMSLSPYMHFLIFMNIFESIRVPELV